MKTLYLIDGYSFLYRAYHVTPPLTNPTGTPIGAVYTFTKMLLKLIQTHKPDMAVVAYDNAATTLRKQIYPLYKGNRSKHEDLVPQFPIARHASQSLGFLNIERPGYEADDIIATVSRKYAGQAQVVIVSSDKDLMQLIGKDVTMYDPMQEKFITPEDVKTKFGVYPRKLRDVLALTGDICDNVPGVPKIGLRTAAKLVNEYGDLEAVLTQTHCITQKVCRKSIENNFDKARLSYRLIGLYYDAPVHIELDDMKLLYNRDQARDFCHLHDFKSLLAKI